MGNVVRDYIALTKPTIMLLVLFTGATALVIEGSMLSRPGSFAMVMLALYLTGECANALNEYLERAIDSRVERTRSRRPLPLGRLKPNQALVFSIIIGLVGFSIFVFWFNWVSALLSLATILFYSLVYILLLKPNTSLNIVVGGIAGAMLPVGAWAAATGQMAVTPWLLFLLVFLWTPPHFWSLAIICKDDYLKVGLPMLPVVRGERETLRQITIYSYILVTLTLAFPLFGAGWLFGLSAGTLGFVLLMKVYQVRKNPSRSVLRSLFGYSLVYLFGLFIVLMVEAAAGWAWRA